MGKTAKFLLTLIIALAVLTGGTLIASSVYAKGIDTVFPNVSLNGMDLSRMTREQARLALVSSGYENNADGVSVSVNFPNGEQMIISGSDAGLSLDASNAAEAAYGFGRTGTFFGNGIAFLMSHIQKTELKDDNLAVLDEEYVRAIVSEYTKNLNDSLLKESSVIEDDRIIIVKDAGSALADESEVYELTITALHKSIDEHTAIEVDYKLRETDIHDVDLTALYNTVNKEPVPAYYDGETKSVVESADGVSFDMESARAALENAKSGEQIVIPLIKIQPELTTEQLEALLFRDVLSSTKTYIDGTSNRLNNVVVSAAAINGLILNPGDVFSFNETVGQRTAERGYKEAGAYVGGRTVQEIGGGICQTSSTLYDAVLYANLEVVARAFHMFTVPYLPAGHDATVSWGSLDFKFKNDSQYPIRVEIITEGRYITATLYGTKLDGTYVKYENVQISKTPYETIQKEDASVEKGKTIVDTSGHSGLVVDTYKLLYDENDNLLSRTLIHRSSYRVQNRVVLVPPGTLTPQTPPDTTPDTTSAPQDSATPAPSPDTADGEQQGEPQVEQPDGLPGGEMQTETPSTESPANSQETPSAETAE